MLICINSSTHATHKLITGAFTIVTCLQLDKMITSPSPTCSPQLH